MISKDEARIKIASLVERFEEQKDFYKRSESANTMGLLSRKIGTSCASQ